MSTTPVGLTLEVRSVQLLRWTPRLRPDGTHPHESSQAMAPQLHFGSGDAGS
jgi:hypothetical protein